MGQFLQINGDYNVRARNTLTDRGTITLDAGNAGAIRVVGNLVVSGSTTTVESVNLEVDDNILLLNRGNATDSTATPTAGVLLRYSGIEIDRGQSADSSIDSFIQRAALVFDEEDPGFATDDPANSGVWQIAMGNSVTGYNFNDSNFRLKRILTNPTTDNGDLTLIGTTTGTGVVKVSETSSPGNYINRILNIESQDQIDGTNFADDILTNKGYVDYAILNNPTFQIVQNLSRVITTDRHEPGALTYFTTETGFSTFTRSAVSIIVSADTLTGDPNTDKALSAQFYYDEIKLEDLTIEDNKIKADSDSDVIVETDGTGKLRTNKGLRLDNNVTGLASQAGAHVIWSSSRSTGKTGLYFRTTDEVAPQELVSKSRALLFSMIF
jgi:hypothetical protein